jgi:hypothetical protein
MMKEMVNQVMKNNNASFKAVTQLSYYAQENQVLITLNQLWNLIKISQNRWIIGQ